MKNLKIYLRRIYRLSVSNSKQNDLLWKDLKKLFVESDWKYGIYEKEKYIVSGFDLGNDKGTKFIYRIDERYFHCQAFILNEFPIELTTDFFILAAHFNNLLNYGVVRINIENPCVEYHRKIEILIPLLYSGEIYGELVRHCDISKNIYWAFQKLIEENEAPAIIIADLLKKLKDNED